MTPRAAGAAEPILNMVDLMPGARRIHPDELAAGDAIFDAGGGIGRLAWVRSMARGRVVTTLREDGTQNWFDSHEPITAIPRRDKPPTLTCHARRLDPADEQRGADRNPGTSRTEAETMTWEPADGNPIAWAVRALNGWGTREPSRSGPADRHTR